MSCYTLFGVFHGHRPAVYINQHLLWALLGSLSVGSSRIASPAFSYFFANRQHRQVAKSLSRAPAHPRYILKKREPTKALVGLARGQGTTQG